LSSIKETSAAYTKGAMIGGVVLTVFALATRRSVLLWATIGVIGGGFVAYKYKEAGKVSPDSSTSKFKNYDLDENKD